FGPGDGDVAPVNLYDLAAPRAPVLFGTLGVGEGFLPETGVYVVRVCSGSNIRLVRIITLGAAEIRIGRPFLALGVGGFGHLALALLLGFLRRLVIAPSRSWPDDEGLAAERSLAFSGLGLALPG